MLAKDSRILGRILKHGVLLLALVEFGCDFDGWGPPTIEDAAREEVAQTVIAYMPLEVMFLDEGARELARLAGEGKVDEIDRVVEGGVGVDSRGRGNVTPLFWSMRNHDGFRKLLDLGADPNIEFGDGESVMHWSAEIADVSFLDSALQHGGDPNLVVGREKETPLFRAARRSIGAVESLLRAGANIDAASISGETPIMAAADVDRYDVVLLLLNRGANFSAVDMNGWSLSMRIAQSRGVLLPDSDQGKWCAEAIDWLEARGVNVQAQ